MKKESIRISIIRAVMFIAFSVCIPSILGAQEYDNTPVTVSKEKVKVDGQICYSHIVLEKQTLYSISKAYGVELEDIYRYNPALKEGGLKKNSIIIIPAIENTDKKETVEAVIEEEVISDVKPDIKDDVKPVVEADLRKTHTVKWFEDIDGIAAKYGVSVEALMKANNLESRKLSKRQKLIIPLPGEYDSEETDENALHDHSTEADSTFQADTIPAEGLLGFKEVNVTLLLPLKATGASSSRQNMDFYSGVLLAVYDLSNEGIRTRLNVHDVADGRLDVSEEELTGSDMIIGPVAAADIVRTFDLAPETKTLISPLDPKAGELVAGRHTMIQAPTPATAQYDDIVSWIKEDMNPQDRCLVITEKGARPTAAITGMMAAIDSSGISYSPLSYSILEGRNVTESLEYLMTENAANRVYIASESEAFVNDVVRNLNLMIHKKYDVVLYAPSKIRSFETIEVDNFHNAHLHISTGYYIDYEDVKVKDFLLRYRAIFNTEPTQFAFQGYDIAKYFIDMCSRHGSGWMDKLDDETTQMLQSTFIFNKTEDGGFTNNGVRRLVYEDGWNVRKVR